jgi:hypothetical protein
VDRGNDAFFEAENNPFSASRGSGITRLHSRRKGAWRDISLLKCKINQNAAAAEDEVL